MRDFCFGYGYLGVDLSHIGEFQHGLTRKHVGSHIHILGSDDARKRSCECRVGELLTGDAFGSLRLFQFTFYLHPFHVRDGSRLMEGQESPVGIFCLLQGGEGSPVSLLHGSRVDGGEQLTFADSVTLIYTDGSNISGDFETEC